MNNNNQQHHQPAKTVLEKIRSGKIKMRPAAYFAFKVGLVVFVSLCILIVSALLLSFMFFSIGISGKLFLLGFGWRGLEAFLKLFPWLFLAADIVLLLVLEWLVKEFSFAYHRPMIYLFLGVALLSFLTALALNGLGLHNALLHQNERHKLPLIGPFYEHVRMPSEKKDVFAGTITAIAGNTLTIQANDYDRDADDGVREVTVSPDELNAVPLKVGDNVFVAGDLEDGIIHAYGIKQIGPLEHDE